MSGVDVKNIMEIMQGMINLELALAKLYSLLGVVWPEDKEFWDDIRADEVEHARNLKALFGMIKKNPYEFRQGRSFNIVAINTIKSHIDSAIESVSKGEIARDRIMIVARDIERSLMESKYPEIVVSNNLEFSNMVAKIDHQTAEHEKKIKDKVTLRKGGK